MSNSEWIDSIEKLLADTKKEDARLKAGVKCAGTKLRGHLKEVSDLCKQGRVEALERRKAMPKATPKAKKVQKNEEVAEHKEESSSKPVKVTKAPRPEPENKMPWKETEPKPIVSKRPKKPAPLQKE